ncbi:MAG: rhodanese-like domain-containing protein [Bacillota bacterium]
MGALQSDQFAEQLSNGAIPLDLRAPAQFARGYVPGSICLQFGRHDLGERAELFLPKDQRYVLVMEPAALSAIAERLLQEAGYTVEGFLQGGLKGWTGPLEEIPVALVAEVHERLNRGEQLPLIDVREDFEYEWGHIGSAVNIPHGEVWQRAEALDKTTHYYVVCNDQVRSAAAASVLKRLGVTQLTLVLGGTVAWSDAGYPLTRTGS